MAKAVVGLGRDPGISEHPDAYTGKSLAAITALLEKTIGLCADLPGLCRGASVFIKPNLVRPNPKNPQAVVTDERVLLGLLRLVKEAGAKRILVGDNPGYGLSLFEALAQMGDFKKKVAEAGAELVFFDEGEKVELPIPGAFVFEKMLAPKAVLDADVYINLPKMKTHVHTLVTLGVKNQYGLVLDDQRMFCHRNDISAKVVDILRVIRPHLTVVDGIVAVQGQAPLSGSVVPDMNVIAAGTDVAAVDAVCCELMGIDVDEVAMLRLIRQEGLGVVDIKDIEVQGASIRETARHFKRPVISCMGAYKEARCIEGGACRGCLSALRHSLDKLHAEGLFEGKAPVSVYVGKPMPEAPNPGNEIGDCWRFGNCAVDLVFDHCKCRLPAEFTPGCPPHILEFYKAYKKKYCG
jgi:uncharacterized protein (DUF362 family)